MSSIISFLEPSARQYRLQKIAKSVRQWSRRREEEGFVVTADQLVERAKQRCPSLSAEELAYIYQIAS